MGNVAIILVTLFLMFGVMGVMIYFLLIKEQDSTEAERILEEQLLKTQTAKQAVEEAKAKNDLSKQQQQKSTASTASTSTNTSEPKRTTFHFIADDKIQKIRLNGKDISLSGLQMPCDWTKTCSLQLKTVPGDVVEFEVTNTGDQGMFRCFVDRDGKTYKTPDDFVANDDEIMDLSQSGWSGTISFWNSGLAETANVNLKGSKHVWVKSMCEKCTAVFKFTVPS